LNLQGIIKERNQTISLIDKVTVKNANLSDSPTLIFGTKKLNDVLGQSIAVIGRLNFFLCMNGRQEFLLGIAGIDGDTLAFLTRASEPNRDLFSHFSKNQLNICLLSIITGENLRIP